MEWVTVTVLIALAGLFITLAKPIISLTRSITELTVVVKNLKADMEGLTKKNAQCHTRLWEMSRQLDQRLDDHEMRIRDMEHKQ